MLSSRVIGRLLSTFPRQEKLVEGEADWPSCRLCGPTTECVNTNAEPHTLGFLQFVNQAHDGGGEVGRRLRGFTQNVKVLRKGACRMREEMGHLALYFLPQFFGHVARRP